jgi:CheY-like chemotaxis protein
VSIWVFAKYLTWDCHPRGMDMTTDHQTEHGERAQGEGPPDAFVEQVKQALEHLYDLSYLQRHPLAEMESAAACSAEIAGQRLRRDLAAAIESLSPGHGVPFRAPNARHYNLLRLRYVQGKTIQEAAHELGISLRQAYRDLRHGEKCVAVVLWARRSASLGEEPGLTQLSSFQAEMALLETRSCSTDVRPLLQRALEAVQNLARQKDVYFRPEIPKEPVIISADPIVARQVLVNTLSYAVQQAQPGCLHLVLAGGEEQASLTLRYELETEARDAPNLVLAQLVDRLGWTVRQEEQPWGTCVISLHMLVCGPVVLVIDDNEGLVSLLDRYLTDRAYRMIAASDGHEGLRLAQELVPDAILLDVMMPEMDGWELLQRLRIHPRTAAVPVIICSVINDPQLAYSLGASLFLPKPVSRDDVLRALRQLRVM